MAKNIYEKILKRENAIALFVFAAAVLSFFGIPQKWFEIDDIQIILIIFGFLALDSLLEKVGFLSSIDNRTKKIEEVIQPNNDLVLLQPREALLSFSERIKNIDEIFISAISANSLLVQEYRTIQDALRKGTNLKILLIDPDNPSLQSAYFSSASSTSINTQKQWVLNTMEMLENLSSASHKGKLQVGLFEGIPTCSIIAYDYQKDDGWIQVEPHIYKKSPVSRPHFDLYCSGKSRWLDYYKGVIDDLWDSRKEYIS